MDNQMLVVAEMTETLETSGMPTDQSAAVVKAVAKAMGTFAVTPEILDTKLGEQNTLFDIKFAEQSKFFDTKFAEQDKLFREHKAEVLSEVRSNRDDIRRVDTKLDKLQDSMYEHQRTMTRYFLMFTLLLFGALASMFAAMFSQLL